MSRMFIKFALGLFVFNSNEVSALHLKRTVGEDGVDPRSLLAKADDLEAPSESSLPSVSDDSIAGDGAGCRTCRGLKGFGKRNQVAIKFAATLIFALGCVSGITAVWKKEYPQYATASLFFAALLLGTMGGTCVGGCYSCCCKKNRKGERCLLLL